MKKKLHPVNIMYVIGVIAVIIGALDPMEGSLVIAGGSILIALSSFMTNDRYRNLFMTTAAMILIGVSCLWYISSLGGFDPKLEWWWIAMILPYPLGWLITIITLIIRAVKRLKPAI